MKTRYLQYITIKQWKSHISLQCRVEINSKCLLSFGREEVYVPWGNDLKNRERFFEGVLCTHPRMKKKGIQSRNSSVSMALPMFTAEALKEKQSSFSYSSYSLFSYSKLCIYQTSIAVNSLFIISLFSFFQIEVQLICHVTFVSFFCSFVLFCFHFF